MQKIYMKLLLKIFLTLFVLVVLLAIFYSTEIKRVNHVLHLFDKDKIVENFRSIQDIMPVSRLQAADNPYTYPKSKNPFTLPSEFSCGGDKMNSVDFMKDSRATGLMVIQNDTVVFEQYYQGNQDTTKNISWSMAKSFLSALIGIAVHEGLIKSLDQTVDEYCPILKGSGYEGVTIKNTLQMSTGIGFNEDYGDFFSDINRWGRGFAMGKSQDEFAATLKNERPQGTYNHYVSINTHVLGMVLTKATGKSVTAYMQEKFWTPMGMQDDAYYVVDKNKMEGVLGLLNATLRDYAKMGSLYLNEGKFNGKQIVSADWVRSSVTPDAPHLMPGENNVSTNIYGYGYQWWIPASDEGEFMAQGVYNQNIYINPTTKTVIVKLSANDRYTDPNFLPSQSVVALEFFRRIADKAAAEKLF